MLLWRRKWQPTPVFLPAESQGQRSLVGCCLWGSTESDRTEVTQQQQLMLLTLLNCGVGEDSWESKGLFKEIKPVSPKENQPWIFIGRTGAEAESPILWPPDEPTHWKSFWCSEKLKTGGEGVDRGSDGWMTSPTQWTWVWASSGRWWWTGKPDVLPSMWSQRAGHDRATEQQQAKGQLWLTDQFIHSFLHSAHMCQILGCKDELERFCTQGAHRLVRGDVQASRCKGDSLLEFCTKTWIKFSRREGRRK